MTRTTGTLNGAAARYATAKKIIVHMTGTSRADYSAYTYKRKSAIQLLISVLYNRQGNRCAICKSDYYSFKFFDEESRVFIKRPHIDHIIPLFAGGTDEIDNLQLLCSKHHREKTNHDAKTYKFS